MSDSLYMGRMKPCWSCGVVDGPCIDPCECAKCVAPDEYESWRRSNPRSYAQWMARNLEDDDEASRWYERSFDLEDGLE